MAGCTRTTAACWGGRGDTLDPADPADKTSAAKNVGNVRKILLDGAGVDLAVLTGSALRTASGMADLDYAAALCRAMNDHSINHWLAADSRFRLAMHICAQDPEGAAAEIDRIGDHPGVVAVMVPCGASRPYGQRFYRPIHAACARHNLTFAMHFGGEGDGTNPAPTAAGYPSYYIESRLARPTFYQVHLASFVFEGVFARFPTLKVGDARRRLRLGAAVSVAHGRRLEGLALRDAVDRTPAERNRRRSCPLRLAADRRAGHERRPACPRALDAR